MSDERLESATGAASRRVLLAGAGAVGATAALAACGTDGDSSAPAGDPGAPGGGGNGDSGAGGPLTATGDVEVGGGVILADQRVVVTQPSQGEFRGFSATCTHLGCLVSSVGDGTINCACHGSRFSIEDGSVVAAALGADPANQLPLPEVEIEVDGEEIRLA